MTHQLGQTSLKLVGCSWFAVVSTKNGWTPGWVRKVRANLCRRSHRRATAARITEKVHLGSDGKVLEHMVYRSLLIWGCITTSRSLPTSLLSHLKWSQWGITAGPQSKGKGGRVWWKALLSFFVLSIGWPGAYAIDVDVTLTHITYLNFITDQIRPFMETIFANSSGLFSAEFHTNSGLRNITSSRCWFGLLVSHL